MSAEQCLCVRSVFDHPTVRGLRCELPAGHEGEHVFETVEARAAHVGRADLDALLEQAFWRFDALHKGHFRDAAPTLAGPLTERDAFTGVVRNLVMLKTLQIHRELSAAIEEVRRERDEVLSVERTVVSVSRYLGVQRERNDARAALEKAEARVRELEATLTKVNAIRNSIVGVQGFNFSEHAYPLVAALDEAGFKGLPYPEARENVGTLIGRANKAEARVRELETALGEIGALGRRCDECEVEMATHLVKNNLSGRRMALCATHTEEARQGIGWEGPLEVLDEYEQETAVRIALAALGTRA